MGTMRDPKWWSQNHSSAWERMKAAMERDWEQTKNDVSDSSGMDLNQTAKDTVKQAAGKQDIPTMGVKTRQDGDKSRDKDRSSFASVEDGYRYGVGARDHYSDHSDWDDRLESKLKEEWNDLKSGRTWDEVKGAVRRGWTRGKDAFDPSR